MQAAVEGGAQRKTGVMSSSEMLMASHFRPAPALDVTQT